MIDTVPRYFVWRWGITYPYRVYSIRRFWMSPDELTRAIWHGDDYTEALRVAKEANAATKPAKTGRKKETPEEAQERLL